MEPLLDRLLWQFTSQEVRGGAAGSVVTDSAAVAVVGDWVAAAAASSTYAWNEAWIDSIEVSNETTAYCRGLWSEIEDAASQARALESRIRAKATEVGAWPVVVSRVLHAIGLGALESVSP